ncbi:hypothetical protein GGTG_01006 [Gaeumannomyces tritici R3-111a-1]|uniref:Zn(2)-C6 fungal-type domain-containing protein n=1 Tax=Gaeumannomyces tritici (strain R3-111a-1) TaxID=644352 RepID=J3NIC4_GAET3|nr:hypothetical protein GGTG_01006 [Gaeumannomyces tritici R3-111a-1]EJT81017.1 hypothetical protein GGTG_01006 [Gaeumannomyces tritici R3-111a-1]
MAQYAGEAARGPDHADRSPNPPTARPAADSPRPASASASPSPAAPSAAARQRQSPLQPPPLPPPSALSSASSAATVPTAAASQLPQHRRVYQACIPCRRRKVRCDLGSVDNPHDPPCVRCRRESKECFFSATRRKRKADDETLSGAEDDYVVRNGRKRRAAASPPPLDHRLYSDAPLTPGGSHGRSQPLPRPRSDSLPAIDRGSSGLGRSSTERGFVGSPADEPNTPLENLEARSVMRREVYGPHDALDLLYKAATDSPHRHGDAGMDMRPQRAGPPPSVSFLVPQPESGRSATARSQSRLHEDNDDGDQSHLRDQHRRRRSKQAARRADGETTEPIDPQLTAKRDSGSDPGYAEALKAWARFRFVRAGWFTAQEAVDYIDYYYKYLSPLTPISPPTFSNAAAHLTLLTEEPILTVALLTIASRYRRMPGTGGHCRSHAIHEQLWTYLRGMIERVVWGQEAFGGGFCGSGGPGPLDESQTSSTAPWRGLRKGSLRTLGTIESLMILTEWHPRALHFPPAEAIDELLLPSVYDGVGGLADPATEPDASAGVGVGAGGRPAAGVGGKRIESWLEPAWRSDRMCWMLLSTAMGLAYELGVFDDIDELLAAGAITRPEYEEETYRLRAHRIKRLLLIYLSQLAGRLGWTNMVPENLRKSDPVVAARRRPASVEGVATPGTSLSSLSGGFNYIPDLELDDQIIHCWAGISNAMFVGNEKLFRSRKHTTDIIQSGRYIALLQEFQPMLGDWWRQFERFRLPPYIRHILTIEYEYVRIYVNSLSLQAVVERCTNHAGQATTAGAEQLSPQTQNYFGKLPLGSLGGFGVADQEYVKEVVDGSRNLLRTVVDGLLPNDYLKHAPVRTYFRIISGAMFLLKTFALGAPRSDVELSIGLMDRTVDALRNCVVDDVHLGKRFADLLESLTSRLRNRFIHAPATGPGGSAQPASGASSAARPSPQPQQSHAHGTDHNVAGAAASTAANDQWRHHVGPDGAASEQWLRPNGSGTLASLSTAAAAAAAAATGLGSAGAGGPGAGAGPGTAAPAERCGTPVNISATPFEFSTGSLYPSGSAFGGPSTPAASAGIEHHHGSMPDNLFGDPSEWNNSSNEMWYLPTGPAFFQNMGDSAVAMTAEGVNVGGIDLLEYMAMDQFPAAEGSGY